MGRIRAAFGYLRRSSAAIEDEIEAELRLHLEQRIEALERGGLSREEAAREALRRFGDLDATRRYCRAQQTNKERHMRRTLAIGELLHDMRITLRGLVRAPGLALTIVATVGLGVGATAAIFAIVDASLLRPLPYVRPAELVRIYTDTPPYRFPFSVADYLALESQQTTFAAVGGYTDSAMAYTDGNSAERLRGRSVSWTFFDVLGVTPAVGRTFSAAEGRPGGPRAVIVSRQFWIDRLGGRPDAIGRPVRLDGLDYTLVGVLGPSIGPLEVGRDFFVAAQWAPPRRKGPFFIAAIGRLRDADAKAAAVTELHQINKRLFPIWQSSYQDEKATWGAQDLKTFLTGRFETVARLAVASVALIWLIACVNASNLLVARVTSRRRELAVRAALGASRYRIVRYLLAESVVLAVAAAVLGVAIAWIGIHLARTAGAVYIPRAQEIVFGGRALAVLIGITVCSMLMFGAVPALHGTGGSVDEGLRAGGRSSTGNRSVRRLRAALVGCQFTVATPLLVLAALLLASLNHLWHVNVGVSDPQNVLTGAVQLPGAQYATDAQVTTFWERFRSETARIPGVIGVAYTDSRPPDDAGNQNNFDLEDFPAGTGQSQPVTTWVDVTPEYFQLFGVRLLEGRLLDARDADATSPSVVVVDRAWAQRFFPGQSAVGKRLKSGGCTSCPWTTVVGIVSAVKYDGLNAPDHGIVYTPMAETGAGVATGPSARNRWIAVRTAVPPDTVVAQLRGALRSIDPALPLSRTATIDTLVAESLEQPRGLSLLVGALAIVALTLSVVGIYGVMAHYVQQQAKDISIRLALGGTPSGVIRLMVGRGMTLVLWGVVAGTAAAFGLARLLASLFFGVAATDFWPYAAICSVMLLSALAACAAPAARAVGIEPAVVLRTD